MHEAAPRLGEAPVGGLTQQIVGEVVGAARGPHDAVALEAVERLEERGRVRRGHVGEHVGRERAPERRGPRQEVARALVEAREPFVEEGVERARHGAAARGARARDLEGIERVAVARREDRRAIDGRIDRPDERRDVGVGEGAERLLLEPAIALERANDAQHGGVVAQLSGARRAREHDVPHALGARDVV